MSLARLDAETTDHGRLAGRARARRIRFSDEMIEIVMGILLAFAGAATSWCGYQAALWDGIQAAHYTQAGAIRSESVRASNQAGQYALADVALLTEWLDATAAGDEKRAEFYRARFRPEFVPAFEAWLESHPLKNPKAHKLPFSQPEYHRQLMDDAAQKTTEAEQAFADGQQANLVSDNYVRATVLFAMSMFFIGIAQQFKSHRVRAALMVVSGLLLVAGVWDVWNYPIANPG